MKRCGGCGLDKPLDQFHKHKVHGRQTQCITCMSAHKQKWKVTNPDRQSDQNLITRHGISREEYETRLALQGGVCATSNCGRSAVDNPLGRKLIVDHDHACCSSRLGCGLCVRGLLCQRCNLILGQAQDDKSVLLGLIEYLGG